MASQWVDGADALLGTLEEGSAGSLAREGLAETEVSQTSEGGTDLEAIRQQWSISVRWENDTFGGTDHFYTDGASLSVIHTGGGWLDSVAE